MHRRNFFQLAGAVTALLGANAATADAYPRTKETLLEVAEKFKGSPLDSDVVTLAVQTATTLGSKSFAASDEEDTFVGSWFMYKHKTHSKKLTMISATKAFGSGFASLTMSEMVETVVNSQYGTPDMIIIVDRDGQFRIGY
jgi:hypothetical protein